MKFSSIFVLLRICLPPTIVGGIASIIVNPTKRQSFRLFSHVDEKIRKIVTPAVTHSYAATSPVWIIFAVLVVATGVHVAPCTKSARPSSANCVTVFKIQQASAVALEASAGFGVPAQISTADDQFVAADATASPEYPSVGTMRKAEDGQASIGLSGPVDKTGHDNFVI